MELTANSFGVPKGSTPIEHHKAMMADRLTKSAQRAGSEDGSNKGS